MFLNLGKLGIFNPILCAVVLKENKAPVESHFRCIRDVGVVCNKTDVAPTFTSRIDRSNNKHLH